MRLEGESDLKELVYQQDMITQYTPRNGRRPQATLLLKSGADGVFYQV